MNFRERRPSRQRLSVLASLVAVVMAQVLLTGCGSDDGKNAPLPRASKAQTLKQAQQVTAGLAASAGVRAGARPPSKQFMPCEGRNGEESTDARYQLLYYADLDVPSTRQALAEGRMRAYLLGRKYHVDSQRTAGMHGGFELDTDKGNWVVSLTSVTADKKPPSLVVVAIASPCLIPPGAHQEMQ